MIGNAVLGEIVRSDPLGAISRPAQRQAVGSEFRFLLAALMVENARF